MIELSHVGLVYGAGDSAVEVLRDVSLSIGAGESVSLTGASGSGKSSLLMLMAGLERPTSGQLRIAGRDLAPLDEDALAHLRRDTMGIVFQSFHLIATMTALENVALPLELAGVRSPWGRAQAVLERVGLGARASHYPSQLSGGEQQRVAIARALIADPQILLADEPTGNLDEETGASIIELLFSIQKERGVTMVLVTHDHDLAAMAQRQIRIKGHLVQDLPQKGVAA